MTNRKQQNTHTHKIRNRKVGWNQMWRLVENPIMAHIPTVHVFLKNKCIMLPSSSWNLYFKRSCGGGGDRNFYKLFKTHKKKAFNIGKIGLSTNVYTKCAATQTTRGSMVFSIHKHCNGLKKVGSNVRGRDSWLFSYLHRYKKKKIECQKEWRRPTFLLHLLSLLRTKTERKSHNIEWT